MPVRIYKKVEAKENGKTVSYYVDALNNERLDIKVNKNSSDLMYYDNENKYELKGSELDAFLDTKEGEELQEKYNESQEIEVDNEEIEPVIVFQQRVTNDQEFIESNSDLFTSNEIVSMATLAESFKLDPSKEFIKQKISGSMFKDAIKYGFDELTYGHKRDLSPFGLGLSKLVSGILQGIYERKDIVKDSDTNAFYQHEYNVNKDKLEAEYRRKIENEAKEIEEEDRQQYIDNKMDDYYKKQNLLIHNAPNYWEITFDRKRYVDKEKVRVLPNIEKDKLMIDMIQKGIMTTLLGNGNPQRAFVQFLNQDKLKKGEYEFNQKAIKSFVNSNFINTRDREKIAIEEIDSTILNSITDKYAPTEHIEETTYKRFVAEGRNLFDREERDNKTNKECFEKYAESKVSENSVEDNEKIADLLDEYKKAQSIRDKRPWHYFFTSPIKNIKEYAALQAMKNTMKANLVDGTNFKAAVEDAINTKYNDKSIDEKLNNVSKLIKEPLDPNMINVYKEKYIKDNLKVTDPENIKEEVQKEIRQQIEVKELDENRIEVVNEKEEINNSLNKEIEVEEVQEK